MESADLPRPRIGGVDAARSLALLGMFIVHAVGIWAFDGTGWASSLEHHLEGRSMPLFLVLSGVGLEFLLRGTDRPWRTMIGRSIVLLLVGLWLGGHTAVAVIIPFYAAYLLLGTALRRLPDTGLLLAAAGILTIGSALRFHGDRFPALTESSGPMWLGDLDALAHPVALLSQLFVVGVYPVLPAGALVVLGMWVGRRVQRCATAQERTRLATRLAIAGVALVAVTATAASVTNDDRQQALIERSAWDAEQMGSSLAESLEEQAAAVGMTVDEMLAEEAEVTGKDLDDIRAYLDAEPVKRALWPWLLVTTEAHNELPGWLLSSAGSSLVVIALCLLAADRRYSRRAVTVLAPLGRSSLTVYALHIGVIWGIYRLHPESTSALVAVGVATGVWLVLVVGSSLWSRRFGQAPLERLVRAAGRRAASPLRVAPAIDDRHVGNEAHT